MSYRAIAALVTAFLAANATAAAAQMSPRLPAVVQTSRQHVDEARLAAFEHARLSLDEAISITESTVGGMVIEASFQLSNGRAVYLMKTFIAWDGSASDRSVWEGMIDARTGKVIGEGRTIPLDRLDRADRAGLAGLQRSDASLGEAVVAAQDNGGGKAISVRLGKRKGQIVFDVRIVKDRSPIDVAVDATDGRVVS